MKKSIAALLLVYLSWFAVPAHAALFCVEAIGISPQCLYDDARQCRQQALRDSGTCLVNPKAVTSTIGGERFCVVTENGLARCIFSDVANCEREAQLGNSVCMRNINPRENQNPYRYELNTVN
jgi:hypothetical protein